VTADNVRMRILVLAVLAIAAPARAGGLALESFTGDRPADATRLLGPVLEELAARGFSSDGRAYDVKVSRPSIEGGVPRDFAAQIDAGFKLWVGGKFGDAIAALGRLVETAHANTGAFAKDQSLREPMLKALIALALSNLRNGDPGAARTTFDEILHGYPPDVAVSRAMYGGEAYEAFEQARRDDVAAGRGKLTVNPSDDTAVVFVDEMYRGVGTTTLELAPGDYRVCVLFGKQPSRNHHVVIAARDDLTVAIDPKLDQAVRTTGWTGFSFASAADREAHEGPYAAAFANALGASAVAVVGIDTVRGHPAVVGSLVSLQDGREIRRASVAMEPDPSNERLHALARYLAGQDPAPGLEVERAAEPPPPPTVVAGPIAPLPGPAETPSGRWGGWKWLTGAIGVGGLASGGVLLALDGRCKDNVQPGHPCNNVYASSPGDYIALAVGGAFAAVSIYLFATDHRAPARTAFVAPAPGGAIAGYAASW